MSLAEQIQGITGVPASVRVGTVTSASPVSVQVQSTTLNAATLGVLGSYDPAVGDVVALLGQSTQAGTDPATWLVLGEMVASGGLGRSVGAIAFVASNGNLDLTAVATLVPGTATTITSNRAGATLISIWSADMASLGAVNTTGIVEHLIDGAAAAASANFANGAVPNVRATNIQINVTTLATAGVHTLSLRGVRSGGADAMIRVVATHTRCLAIIIE